MGFKINKFFLLITLILLQSCSGGRVGNFLESSFKNIEKSKTDKIIKNNLENKSLKKSKENPEENNNIEKSKTDKIIKNNLENNSLKSSKENPEKNKIIKESKTDEGIKDNLNNKTVIKFDKKIKNNKIISEKDISLRKIKYQPQSYKIIFILKDVDPKDPTAELRNILRNSDMNFEIEKIERFVDPKNKSIKRN